MRSAWLLLCVLSAFLLRGEETPSAQNASAPGGAKPVQVESPEPERLDLRADEIEKYVTQLGDEKFSNREMAYKTLLACGPAILPAVQNALGKTKDPELLGLLQALSEHCDMGGRPVNGLSVKLTVEVSENLLILKTRYFNQSNDPLLIVLYGFSTDVPQLFEVLDGGVQIRPKPSRDGASTGFEKAKFAEIPAGGYYDSVTKYGLQIDNAPLEYAGLPYLVLKSGIHSFHVCLREQCNLNDSATPRRYDGENGYITSSAPIWTGVVKSNSEKVTLLEKK